MSDLDDVVREYEVFDEESAVKQASAQAEVKRMRAELADARQVIELAKDMMTVPMVSPIDTNISNMERAINFRDALIHFLASHPAQPEKE